MTTKNFIKELWEEYRDSVLPRDASVPQLVACKRAFFAGVTAYMNWEMTCVLGIPEEEAEAKLQAIHDEILMFVRSGGEPKCPYCETQPIIISAKEFRFGPLRTVMFVCADCFKVISMNVLEEREPLIKRGLMS